MAQEDKGSDMASHDAGTGKGEEKSAWEGKEAGRSDEGETGADRPAGTSTARDSTGINADDENPVDPNSPNLPPA
ncbi:MAG: hypothetical protein WA584_20640 [Pyrinomonadaceae bacterium]